MFCCLGLISVAGVPKRSFPHDRVDFDQTIESWLSENLGFLPEPTRRKIRSHILDHIERSLLRVSKIAEADEEEQD